MKILDTSLRLAKELVPKSNDKFSHVAFLFERNKLLAIGQNNMKQTSGRASYFGKRYKVSDFVDFAFIHAEIDAISKIWSKIHIDKKIKLVIIRLGKDGRLLMSKPCKNCRMVLDALGLERVWWSNSDGGFSNA